MQAFGVDQVDAETGAWGDVLGEVGLDLLGPRGLAGGRVAGDYYQLLEEGGKEGRKRRG